LPEGFRRNFKLKLSFLKKGKFGKEKQIVKFSRAKLEKIYIYKFFVFWNLSPIVPPVGGTPSPRIPYQPFLNKEKVDQKKK